MGQAQVNGTPRAMNAAMFFHNAKIARYEIIMAKKGSISIVGGLILMLILVVATTVIYVKFFKEAKETGSSTLITREQIEAQSQCTTQCSACSNIKDEKCICTFDHMLDEVDPATGKKKSMEITIKCSQIFEA